jgi:hypothetical protein
LGYTTGSSTTVPGLRLVDWIAGEVRNFFYKNPGLISERSDFSILSPYLNPEMTLIDGRAPFYKRSVSQETTKYFVNTEQRFLLPHIKGSFARGLISYYAEHGEARHLSIPEQTVYDMAD